MLLVLIAPSTAVQQETSQEIKLESLDESPGILPFRLGTTRLISHYHTFIQTVNLHDIRHKINILQSQLSNFKTKLANDTYMLYELQVDYLTNKLSILLDHLDTLDSSRNKRGLVDGLGSVIKSITGNLDYRDAARYDSVLKSLDHNQDKLITELNHHISVSKEWMSHHSSAIDKLAKNQVQIEEVLNLLLDKSAYSDSTLIKFAKFAQLLIIITENTDDMLSELCRVENILAFIRVSSTHHSSLNIKVLSYMLDRIRHIYGNRHVLDIELREYYDLILPGYYYSNKSIVIIFKIPIFDIETYDFYRLAMIPNRRRQVLVPPFPYIATNKNGFVYIEAECPKYDDWFLCKEKLEQHVRHQSDCIHNIIHNQSLDKSCRLINVTTQHEAMEELDDSHYTISFPKPTKIHTVCGRQDYKVLQGSYCSHHTAKLLLTLRAIYNH